jgi:hypothetical protein
VWRLHPLAGDLAGCRRIIFRFEQGRAFGVDLIDDH